MHWSVRTDNASQLHLSLSSLPLPIALQLATASWLAEMAWNGQAVAFRLDWWLRQGEKGEWIHVWYVCVAAGGSCLATVKPKMHCAFWRIYKSPAACLPACCHCASATPAFQTALIKDIKKYIRYMFHMCSISFIYIFFFTIFTSISYIWVCDCLTLGLYVGFIFHFYCTLLKLHPAQEHLISGHVLCDFPNANRQRATGSFQYLFGGHCLCANLFAIILARIS